MIKKQDPIKKITLADESTVYRFTIDVGVKPKIDKATRLPILDKHGEQVTVRDQRTFTFPKLGEARAERARIISERARGAYVAPTKLTVQKAVDEFLAGKRNISPGTRRTYVDALKRVTDRLGYLQLQQLTKAHIDALVTELLTSGWRLGKTPKGISARSVKLTLTLLAAVCQGYVRSGKLARNPVLEAEKPDHVQPVMKTWSAAQAAAFLTVTAFDRLAAAWMLSLYGLRRGEVLGLRWSDIDLVAKTVTISWERTSVAGVIVEKEPKTERGKRTLPLDDDLVAVLTALWFRSLEERARAGEAYAAPCGETDPKTRERCSGDHVFVDEIGRPYRPEWYSDRFQALVATAKLPRIRLHDARHTTATLMHARGIEVAIISAWLGHAKASFTVDTYIKPTVVGMAAAAGTLRDIYTPAASNVA